MCNVYFFTGFPGFIASEVIKQIIKDNKPYDAIYVLVLPSMVEKAKREIERIAVHSKEKFFIIPGDITKENLSIESQFQSIIKERVTHVFHLAAIYDLAVPKKLAYDVNVNGTKCVNDWVQTLRNLKRYIYFSTAYVSGSRVGRILENELDMGQEFKNHYEHTKFQAEVLVKKLKGVVPTTVIRPGIVKGHSKTGETSKFDGPYFALNFLDRIKYLPIIPYVGDGEAKVNFVPVDYIIRATMYLSHADAGINKTYHLTDPNPYSVKELYDMFCQELINRKPKGRIPVNLTKGCLTVPTIRKWLRIEKEAMDYFTCKSSYDCSQAQKDLVAAGIYCPDFKESLPAMIDYYKKHKDDKDKHVLIR